MFFSRAKNRPKRRWWQHLIRVAGLVALGLSGAYVTLPYWVPTGLLRSYLVGEMSRQMGVNVHIGSVSLSWSGGIEIQQLQIDSPEGFCTEPMVRIDRIRSELSPVNMLVHKRFGWMVLESPKVFVHVRQDGEVNFSPLSKLHFEADPRRITVSQADAMIRLPGNDKLLRVRVSDAEYVAGRINKLGRVTVSAMLDQEGTPAPVSLRLAAGGQEIVAADAIFNFSNIDMDQLNLPKLLGLPLKKLSGLSRGSLNLQINHQGVVDQFSFNLLIRNLDVQPSVGAKLPIIDEAGIRIVAAYDTLTERLDIQSLSIRLPGIDLAGRASLFADIGRAQWQAIKMFDLEGTIHPGRLAGLITGRRELRGDFEIDGSLRVRLTAAYDKQFFTATAMVEGTSLAIRKGDRQIKPPGERLTGKIAFRLNPRNWHLRVDGETTRIALGENTFHGGGTIRDVRRLMNVLRSWDGDPSIGPFMRVLSLIDGDVVCQIRDLESLRWLIEPVDALVPVQMDGLVELKCSLRQFADTQMYIGVLIPPETYLGIGDLFIKNPSSEQMTLSVDLAGDMGGKHPSFRKFDVDLMVGEGRFSVRNTTLKLLADDKNHLPLSVEAEGTIYVVNIESILNYLPKVTHYTQDRVRGSLECQYRTLLADGLEQLSLDVDLERLDLNIGSVFSKSAGYAVRIIGDVTRRHTTKVQESYRVNVTANLPLLEDELSVKRLSGEVVLDGIVSWREGNISGTIHAQADQLEFTCDVGRQRGKIAGVPLRALLSGAIVKTDGGVTKAIVDQAQLTLAQSSLVLSGTAVLSDAESAVTPGSIYLPLGVKEFQAEAQLDLTISDSLLELVPELKSSVRLYGISGKAAGQLKILADQRKMLITSHLDARELSISHVGPFAIATPTEAAPDRVIRIGAFEKPLELPAYAEMELTVPSDLSRLQVNNLSVKLGDLSILADALVRRDSFLGSLVEQFSLTDAHLSAWTKHPETLARIAPSLKQYGIDGDIFLEFQWTDDGRGEGRITSAMFKTDRLRANYRGKPVSAAGEIYLGDVHFREGRIASLGQLRTDEFELRAGKNHCWVSVDLRDIPQSPTGEFELLGSYLDDKDLQDWLWDDETVSLSPTDLDAILADLRAYLLPAKISGRIGIKKLRSFDPSVKRSYDVREMELQVSMDRGHIKLGYVTGLNGGTMRTGYEMHLDDDEPLVTCKMSLRDIIATENFQPQLAKYFPGNTVYGLFNRTETSKVYLRDLVGNFLDYRHRMNPVGTAKTIAIDGLLEGRAAPKFVTRIFRGLNLTKYRYNKMTGFATFRPDGIVENDMIFSGQTYDIYTKGTTDANNIGHYEVGLILVGTPQSAEWNHLYRQGRIPIFKLKARIEGGKMHDEVVSYLWPNETLFVIFLENNIFYRLWLAAQKK